MVLDCPVRKTKQIMQLLRDSGEIGCKENLASSVGNSQINLQNENEFLKQIVIEEIAFVIHYFSID
jgi:hypothetical protein